MLLTSLSLILLVGACSKINYIYDIAVVELYRRPWISKGKLTMTLWLRVLLSLLLYLHLFRITKTTLATGLAKPGCQSDCGNVSIPYPFGTREGCYFNPSFLITCNYTFNPETPTPFITDTILQVFQISLSVGQVQIDQYIAKDCYDKSGYNNTYNVPFIYVVAPYMFSPTRNKFIAVGCDTIGKLRDLDERFNTGCISTCNSTSYITNGTCEGIGCCESPIPRGLQSFDILVDSFENHTKCWSFNPCSYGFLVDEGWFNFNLSSFYWLQNIESVPVTLDWAVGNQTCEEAKNLTSYACVAENSVCLNSSNGVGYLCNCSEGYSGNPYLEGGCEDINECDGDNPCIHCKNIPGSYQCYCPRGMHGDGKMDGRGCQQIYPLILKIAGGGFALLFLFIVGPWSYWVYKKKKLIELKEEFFRRNGGFLLQKQVSSFEGSSQGTMIYGNEELKAATNNFSEALVLGRGGSGTVYKGTLLDNRVVAIKKSKITDDYEVEQFINELVVLSHINHRNIVKLLGCCLERQVPLLVYEFVSNGTLSHHIHDENHKGSLSLDSRLRIAAETSGALAYLHSAASTPIIHRDVKSTNILLDDNYTAKVSDFGVSRLVPLDKQGLLSLVRGTYGYLDPEYFQTTQFTDRSDVYSFGVVLVELLTGEKPIDMSKPPENRNLAMHFLSCMKDGQLFDILEDRLIDEGSPEQLIAVAELARRCLRLRGEDRPSMKEVAIELEGQRGADNHPWIIEGEDEQSLLGDDRSYGGINVENDSSVHFVRPFNIMR